MSEGKSQKTQEAKRESPDWLLDNIAESSQNAPKALTVAQLRTVETLYGVELDSVLLKQIERNYPHLREYPKRLKKMGRITIK